MIIFFGESESASHLVVCSWSLRLPGALPTLISYSAEVNIGVAAACLPTLLPLYRLLRDKIVAAREGSTSTTGRFTRFFFGQGRKSNVTSQKALWETRNEHTPTMPQNRGWANSTSQAFIRIGKARDEDMDMQTSAVSSH